MIHKDRKREFSMMAVATTTQIFIIQIFDNLLSQSTSLRKREEREEREDRGGRGGDSISEVPAHMMSSLTL